MPYSERVEKKESRDDSYMIEKDPRNVIVIHDWYLQHACGTYAGTLSRDCKGPGGDVWTGRWVCSACNKIIPPEVVMAARLAQ